MTTKQHSTLVLVVSQVLAILILSILFAIYPAFIIYRYLLGLHLERKYKYPIEFLRGLDALFGIYDKHVPLNAEGCHIFRGTCDIDKLRQRIDERWLQPRDVDGRWKYLRLRQHVKQELGYLFWVPQKDFRIENHVLEYDGPPLRNKEDLQKLVSRQYENLPVDKGIYWQCILVHLPDTFCIDKPEPQYMIFVSCNHVMYDGISASRMYMMLFDEDVEAVFPSHSGGLQIGLIEHLLFWRNVLLRGLADYFLRLFTREEHFLCGSALTGNMLASISETISLKKVKEIKNFYKTSVNEVLLSCIVGAIRRHFVSEGQPIPSLLKFQIPMSFHALNKEVKVENNISAGTVQTAVYEPTAVGRLMKTKAAFDEMKTSPDTFLSYLIATTFTNRIPIMFTSDMMRRISATAMVTCLPIAMPEKMFGNTTLKPYMGFGSPVGLMGCGIAVTITSSADSITMTFKADSSVMKSQEKVDRITGYFAKEIDELHKGIK